MRSVVRLLLLCAILLAGLAGRAAAQGRPADEPVWEAGAGVGVGYLPDYPGANRYQWRVLPLPYLIYRGSVLRTDEGQLRGRLLRGRDLEFDVSVSGSFNARSSGNGAREGMPDLDWLGEIGPRLRWTVARPGPAERIDLRLPVRAVFSTNFSDRFDYRGFIFAPDLSYERGLPFGNRSRLRLGAGPVFATEELMDYFYRVAPQYVRPGRPAYDARAGYLGSRFQATVSTGLTERLRLFALGRFDLLSGATNGGSPLLRDEANYGLGFGLAYSFWQSARRTADTE